MCSQGESSWITVDRTGPHERLKYFHAGDTDAAYWDALWAAEDRPGAYARELKGHLPLFLRRPVRKHVKPGGRVLEAGCGLAHFTVAMNALGYAAEGVDYAPQAIERVRRRFPGLPLAVADVRRLGVPDETYDAVYSPGVVEHFEAGPEPILRETFRVLKPGGVALVTAPCHNPYRRRLASSGRFDNANGGKFYQYAFTPREMTGILRGVGFEVPEVRGFGTLKTLLDHGAAVARLPLGPLTKPAAVALDLLPVTRHWGHSCLWVARRPR